MLFINVTLTTMFSTKAKVSPLSNQQMIRSEFLISSLLALLRIPNVLRFSSANANKKNNHIVTCIHDANMLFIAR